MKTDESSNIFPLSWIIAAFDLNGNLVTWISSEQGSVVSWAIVLKLIPACGGSAPLYLYLSL